MVRVPFLVIVELFCLIYLLNSNFLLVIRRRCMANKRKSSDVVVFIKCWISSRIPTNREMNNFSVFSVIDSLFYCYLKQKFSIARFWHSHLCWQCCTKLGKFSSLSLMSFCWSNFFIGDIISNCTINRHEIRVNACTSINMIKSVNSWLGYNFLFIMCKQFTGEDGFFLNLMHTSNKPQWIDLKRVSYRIQIFDTDEVSQFNKRLIVRIILLVM